MKVLFHVYNISGYLMAELAALHARGAEIAVLYTPYKDECPEEKYLNYRWVRRPSLKSLSELKHALGDFTPDVFLCGGWVDKLALAYASELHQSGKRTVLLIDTPWQGKLRQYMHCLLSRFSLIRIFDYAWGSGEPQERHLRHLGFPLSRIRRGYYCADTHKFAPIGASRLELSQKANASSPHTFLYIGRYVAVKNMRRMERAFLAAKTQLPNCDWKLRCIGGGELWDERTIHPTIEHLGYRSPDEIQNYVNGAGCFVLPSVYEPWGVVVHEAALMGLPLLCSNQIQAATAYLQEGKNGFKFDPLNEGAMADAFVKIMRLNDADLLSMGKVSYSLGMTYTVDDWAKRVEEFMK